MLQHLQLVWVPLATPNLRMSLLWLIPSSTERRRVHFVGLLAIAQSTCVDVPLSIAVFGLPEAPVKVAIFLFMSKTRHLSDFEHSMIVDAENAGFNYIQNIQLFGSSCTTVDKVFEECKKSLKGKKKIFERKAKQWIEIFSELKRCQMTNTHYVQ
ncbi:hypothetical protein AVEN_239844-1 [Araneus ventricosus]|uniref:Uncharacterized protein n=1 Tax=Araneus ventricosus TaxID=182803 RepID=A0A4Y2LFI3_ARAVE|nr:hypothetical protein AVEN_239844-1 [Araneus ventricosus]